MDKRTFEVLTLDASLRSVRHADGREIAFTRQERALLAKLLRHAGVVVSRAELMDALVDTGRAMTDRNVDHLVNRLRRKLADNPSTPVYIATQYGEGYVWIGEERAETFQDSFILIGPVRETGPGDGWSAEFLSRLARHIDRSTGPGRAVMLAPAFASGSASARVGFTIDVGFHAENGVRHIALVMRDGRSQRILDTSRAIAADGDGNRVAQQLARWVRDVAWRSLARVDSRLSGIADSPAEIRLHEAALALVQPAAAWQENRRRLEQARAEAPADPELAVLWGLNLFSQLIHWQPGTPALTANQRAEIERQIEDAVFGALPGIEANPLLKLGAAKLLMFIDRGHLDLAEWLAGDAFNACTAFAAAHATRGQILMCRGRIDEALALYDSGLALAEDGSVFQVYLLVLKCTALMAAGLRREVAEVARQLYGIHPPARMQIGLMMVSPDEEALDQDLAQILSRYDEASARAILTFLFNTSARQFLDPGHRANVVMGLAHHVRRRLGVSAIPDEVAAVLGIEALPQ